MPPVAFTLSCLLATVCPFFFAKIVTCQAPPLSSRPAPSYIPFPFSERETCVRIAAIPIAGIAGMEKVIETSVPAIAPRFASVIFTLKVLLPL